MNDKINGRTPEEIYKALRCVITQINDDCEDTCDSCKNCPNNFDGGRRELAVHLADAIVRIQQLERERDAAVEAQPKWISVEERLPGDPLDGVGDVVELLIDKGDVKEVLPGYYDHDEKDWVIYFGDILGDYRRKAFSWWRVIKWRPFPEPPKEE